MAGMSARIVLSLLAAFFLLPAGAVELSEDTWLAAAYVGRYEPGTDLLKPDYAYGGRFGRMITDGWGLLFGVEYAELADDVADPANFKLKLLLADLDLGYFFRRDTRMKPHLQAGIGGVLADRSGDDVDISGAIENSLTLGAGAGLVIEISDLVSLWPVARARWFAARDEDATDVEYGLNLLFTWD